MIDTRKPDIDRIDVLSRHKVIPLVRQAVTRPVRRRPVAQYVLGDRMNAPLRNAIPRKGIADELAGVVRIGAGGQIVLNRDQASLVV